MAEPQPRRWRFDPAARWYAALFALPALALVVIAGFEDLAWHQVMLIGVVTAAVALPALRMWRRARIGTFADHRGLVVCRGLRQVRVAWEDVERITGDVTDPEWAVLLTAYLRDGSDIHLLGVPTSERAALLELAPRRLSRRAGEGPAPTPASADG